MDKKERCIYNDCSYCTYTFEDSSELMNLLGENSHLKKHCSTLEIEVDQLERKFKGLEYELSEYRNLKMVNTLDENKVLKQENTDLKNDKIFVKTNIEALQNENDFLRGLNKSLDEKSNELYQENEKLKEELEVMINYHSTAAKFIESHERFEQENEKLKEAIVAQFELHKKFIIRYQQALRKCDPLIYDNFVTGQVDCVFCKVNARDMPELGHAYDCEYVKLTK